MSKIWFKPFGWFYYPISFIGWIIAFLFLLLFIHDFIVIDGNSHSVSDTYYGFMPYGSIYIIIYNWIATKKS